MESKVPTEIPESDQEVFLLIMRQGQIVDLRVVGDGLLGKLLKTSSKRSDGVLTEIPYNPLTPSAGYRAYALNVSDDKSTSDYVNSIRMLKLAMNLLTSEEYNELEDIFQNMGSRQDGDIVQFYGCF